MSTLMKIALACLLLCGITFGLIRQGEATNSVLAVSVRHYVWSGSGFYEVLAGSGGGGAFINGSRAPMSDGTPVVGRTDRVARNEYVEIDFTGGSLPSRVGHSYNNVNRDWINNPWMPIILGFTVSNNAADDDLDSFFVLNGSTTRKEIPLGTR